jgi:hypothetical protein
MCPLTSLCIEGRQRCAGGMKMTEDCSRCIDGIAGPVPVDAYLDSFKALLESAIARVLSHLLLRISS